MSAPRRCRFCDEPLKPDNEGSECDAGCRAGFALCKPPDDDDEDEPTAALTDSAHIRLRQGVETTMTSLSPDEEHAAFKAARKQSSLAQAWRYDQQYEDGLAARERDPALFATLSADHRSSIGYYEAAKLAAKAEGLDISGGSR